MDQHSVEALAIVPGPNLEHLTGSEFHLSERPVVFFVSNDSATFVLQSWNLLRLRTLEMNTSRMKTRKDLIPLLTNSLKSVNSLN